MAKILNREDREPPCWYSRLCIGRKHVRLDGVLELSVLPSSLGDNIIDLIMDGG